MQDTLQSALSRLCGGDKISVQGSGRTDAGVHALGQVAHADVPPRKDNVAFWQSALNALLPPQIRVLACIRVREDFHARYSATGKTYDYLLWTGTVLPPHQADRCWHVPGVNTTTLRCAAKVLAGRHDFRCFSANRGTPVYDTRRHLRRVTVSRTGEFVRLRFEGDGFLYKMARMMTAAIVRVAQGKSTPAELRARLAGKNASLPREVAPPGGLYLVNVRHSRIGRTQTG